MTLAESTLKYPALMAYIADRNNLAKATDWCSQLRVDEELARTGELTEVAQQMTLEQADYGAFLYNSAMGTFSGLSIRPGNGEPEHSPLASRLEPSLKR
jgi:hypothetical protein